MLDVASTLTLSLLTVPDAATRCGVALDRFRTDVRRREPELIAAGVMLKAGKHRLIRADRLNDLLGILGGDNRG